MSAPLPFPHDAKIKGVLEMLFDKKVDFERGETLRAPTVACVLRRDDGTVHGCIVGDAAMTATFGALLSMSPPRVAHDELDSGESTAISQENVAEIANVLSSLYNASGGPHVKLAEVSLSPSDVYEHIGPILEGTGRMANLVVTIAGYPPARMTLAIKEEGIAAPKVTARKGPAAARTGFDGWR